MKLEIELNELAYKIYGNAAKSLGLSLSAYIVTVLESGARQMANMLGTGGPESIDRAREELRKVGPMGEYEKRLGEAIDGRKRRT